MEILGIGAPELVFVIIIALIVLGPKDMQKAGRTIGRWLNQLIRSDGWKAFQQTSREIRNLPTSLMREANLELAETEKELRKATDFRTALPASSPSHNPSGEHRADLAGTQENENSIRPPSANLPNRQGNLEPKREGGIESESDVNSSDQDA